MCRNLWRYYYRNLVRPPMYGTRFIEWLLTPNHTFRWRVISMEFLRSFLRRHLAGKPVVASPTVGCFLRLWPLPPLPQWPLHYLDDWKQFHLSNEVTAITSGRVATSFCFKARLRAKPSPHVSGMTRLDLSKPKKLELRLSPLLNQWAEASQPRLQFCSPTVEKTWNATVQFSSSRSLSPCPIVSSGGDSAYERGGDACLKFWIKPLKKTDLGVAQDFFDPYKRRC